MTRDNLGPLCATLTATCLGGEQWKRKKEDGPERTAGTAGAISGGIGTGILVASLIPVPVVDVLVGAVVGAVAGTEVGRRLGKATFNAGSAFIKTFTA